MVAGFEVHLLEAVALAHIIVEQPLADPRRLLAHEGLLRLVVPSPHANGRWSRKHGRVERFDVRFARVLRGPQVAAVGEDSRRHGRGNRIAAGPKRVPLRSVVDGVVDSFHLEEPGEEFEIGLVVLVDVVVGDLRLGAQIRRESGLAENVRYDVVGLRIHESARSPVPREPMEAGRDGDPEVRRATRAPGQACGDDFPGEEHDPILLAELEARRRPEEAGRVDGRIDAPHRNVRRGQARYLFHDVEAEHLAERRAVEEERARTRSIEELERASGNARRDPGIAEGQGERVHRGGDRVRACPRLARRALRAAKRVRVAGGQLCGHRLDRRLRCLERPHGFLEIGESHLDLWRIGERDRRRPSEVEPAQEIDGVGDVAASIAVDIAVLGGSAALRVRGQLVREMAREQRRIEEQCPQDQLLHE